MMLIKTKTVYGVSKIYPADEQALLIAQLAGTTTLTEATVAVALKLGLQVSQIFGNGELRMICELSDIVPA